MTNSNTDQDPLDAEGLESPPDRTVVPVSRRNFLGGAAGVGAAGLLLGAKGAAQQARVPLTSSPQVTTINDDDALGPENANQRREHMYRVRVNAAKFQKQLPTVEHENNGDDELYDDRRGSYSKALPHDAIGEVDPAAYEDFLDALRSGAPADFEAVPMGAPGDPGPAPGNTPIHKLVNPQAGLAFDLEGTDCHQIAQPPAPAFASAWLAGEGVENTWMAHLRDVPFRLYGSDPLAATAIADLNALSDFRGPKQGGVVTAQTLFRDPFPGCTVGPYLSQFFWKPQPYGAQDIDPRSHTAVAGLDYMTTQAEWVARQNGVSGATSNTPGGLVYMRNGRDIGQWVHIDVLFQAYFQAFLVMASVGVPANPGNPYHGSASQVSFGTFGGPYFATLVGEVSTRALKAVWFQKWFVHRRLRPEVYLGRVHVHLTGQKSYDLHPEILGSDAVAESFSRNGTYLLPMAFPEGSPAHPSYGAGHATVAGACVTILKALFDTERLVTDFFAPVEPTDDGSALVPYLGGDVGSMTIAGELNKIASNVATGRNIAGVHWRTDGIESLLLGEQVAISILRDQKGTYNEPFGGYTFKKFDGTTITV